ncbi:MAG: glucose-6-phosphate isomerase family protein [Propioniciclava sp.]
MTPTVKRVAASQLPIDFDADQQVLHFAEGITCAGSSHKTVGQMRGLLRDETDLDDDEPAYAAYRDIGYEADRPAFTKQDTRYDITAIRTGTVNGEFKKTSGHFHGFIPGTVYPYPEVYEVLQGRAAFILQKSVNAHTAEELRIDEVRIAIVNEGESIAIPPSYGHGSVNIGEETLLFSNLAIVSCPLDYASVKDRRGLAYYLVKADTADGFEAVPNPHYVNLPEAQIVRPSANPAVGITFGKSSYRSYVENPATYDFLNHPEPYLAAIDSTTRPEV